MISHGEKSEVREAPMQSGKWAKNCKPHLSTRSVVVKLPRTSASYGANTVFDKFRPLCGTLIDLAIRFLRKCVPSRICGVDWRCLEAKAGIASITLLTYIIACERLRQMRSGATNRPLAAWIRVMREFGNTKARTCTVASADPSCRKFLQASSFPIDFSNHASMFCHQCKWILYQDVP